MRRTRPWLLVPVLAAVLGSGCALEDAGTSDGASGFDRTGSAAPIPGALPPPSREDLAGICALTGLPAGTPAELTVLSRQTQAALEKIRAQTYTPQMAAIVRSAAELEIAVQTELALAQVNPSLVASFKGLTQQRLGTVSSIRAKLAAACGEKVPG